jgi:phospholipid/cholesterol/gamma-HCH transport system permease protein
MTSSTPSPKSVRTKRATDGLTRGLHQLGRQTQFYARTLQSLGDALVRYRGETIRLIAQMGLGSGALALIGGATVVIGFLTFAGGTVIAIQGYSSLSGIGVQAFAGFVSAFVNVRLVAPLVAAIGLAATIGAGATAQLGAMRISEEIDALEVMGLDSMSYLVGTRVLAMAVFTPFMFVASTGFMYIVNYFLNVIVFQSVSKGGYLSVFWSFLTQRDILLSLTAGAFIGLSIVLVGCYYGYNAKGGPVGVGKNTAKSMIINLIIVSVVGAIFQQLFFGGFARAPIAH